MLEHVGKQIFKTIRFANGYGKQADRFNSYYKSGGYVEYITRKQLLDLFNFEGQKIDAKDLKEKFKHLSKKQFVWDNVLSFDKSLQDNPNLCDGEKLASILKSPLSKYLKSNFMNYDKVESFFTIHEDTDHLHIHFGFFEKEKTFKTKNSKELFFKRIGNLHGKDSAYANEFKANVDIGLTDSINFQRIVESRNEIKNSLSEKELNYDKDFYKTICESFYYSNKTKKSDYFYNNLDDYSKAMVQGFWQDVLTKNPELKNKFNFLIRFKQ